MAVVPIVAGVRMYAVSFLNSSVSIDKGTNNTNHHKTVCGHGMAWHVTIASEFGVGKQNGRRPARVSDRPNRRNIQPKT